MSKHLSFTVPIFAIFVTANAQADPPTLSECISAHPNECGETRPAAKRPSKRPAKRRTANDSKARVDGMLVEYRFPEQLNNLQRSVETLQRSMNELRARPSSAEEEQPVIVNIRVPEEVNDTAGDEGDHLFALELGGLISAADSREEVSPGGRLSARFRVGSLQLGLQSSYERIEFEDGSTIEDVVVEPVAHYDLLSGKSRPYFQLSLGYWTERSVWINPNSCGEISCPAGFRNASLTISAAMGISIYPWRNMSFSAEPLAVRFIPDAQKTTWSFVPSASVALHVP